MNNASLSIVAMASKCQVMMHESSEAECDLPQALHPRHLLWMCGRIEKHAEEWPATKLHRWLGFIQCGMLANRIIDFDHAKSMFDETKNAYGTTVDDTDLIDHLDPRDSFELEIGGEA